MLNYTNIKSMQIKAIILQLFYLLRLNSNKDLLIFVLHLYASHAYSYNSKNGGFQKRRKAFSGIKTNCSIFKMNQKIIRYFYIHKLK